MRRATRHLEREICRSKDGRRRARLLDSLVVRHLAVQVMIAWRRRAIPKLRCSAYIELYHLQIDLRTANLVSILEDACAFHHKTIRIVDMRLARQHHLRLLQREEQYKTALLLLGRRASHKTLPSARACFLRRRRHQRLSRLHLHRLITTDIARNKEVGRGEVGREDEIRLCAVQVDDEHPYRALLLCRIDHVKLRRASRSLTRRMVAP